MGSLAYVKQCYPHVKSICRWELMQSPAVRMQHQLPVPLVTRCTNPHKLLSTPQHHMVMPCTLWVSCAQSTLSVRPSFPIFNFQNNITLSIKFAYFGAYGLGGGGVVRDSVLDIVTRYGLYRPGIEPL
jgi:hypothetical protein